MSRIQSFFKKSHSRKIWRLLTHLAGVIQPSKVQKCCCLFCWVLGKVAKYSLVDYMQAKEYMRSNAASSDLQNKPEVQKLCCRGPQENQTGGNLVKLSKSVQIFDCCQKCISWFTEDKTKQSSSKLVICKLYLGHSTKIL